MESWLRAFLITQSIELPIYVRALSGRRPLPRVALAFGPTALTHPLLWLVFPALPFGYWAALVVAETVVVLVEAAWLHRAGARPALAWSVAANAASAGVGFALRAAGVPV